MSRALWFPDMGSQENPLRAISLKWLGQAGFVISSSNGTSIAFDPYLSDLCEREVGLARLVPAPQPAQSLRVDFVLVSHSHPDHLDLDAAAALAANGARFVAPPSCTARLAELSVEAIEAHPQQRLGFDDLVITPIKARHMVAEAPTPDAVGYVVELDGHRIYHSGDTEYDRSLLDAASLGPLSVAMICMNGSGGNMDVVEASFLASRLAPDLAIPMHFGMWERDGYGPSATLDPQAFVQHYERLTLRARSWIPRLGESILVY